VPQVETPASLHLHYKVLGLEDGADFASVQSTYNKLASRCDPTRFPEGTEDRKMAEGIKARVDAAYQALRDALDSTAGRFDKLELE
jgi:preprotein translocase subunit Sec63